MAAAGPAVLPDQPLTISQPGPEHGLWLGFAVGLLALAAVAWIARRRIHKLPISLEAESGLRRLARLLYSAATFAIVMVMALLPELMLSVGFSWRDLPNTVPWTAAFTLVGLLMFGIVHFWLGLGRPIRDRRWLIRAMLAFNLMIFACLTLVAGLAGDPLRVLDPILLWFFAAASAAGLVWWAWLPAPLADTAARFE